jgi:2-polyprenyl-3-methyl-5-hydroxy-6-metoxy-1,4-benzoquinol methylase
MTGPGPALRWGRRHADVLVAWEPVNVDVVAALAQRYEPVRTPSFSVLRAGDGDLRLVVHRLDRSQVDNDIARLVADELIRPGIVAGPRSFERCFAGVVESTDSSRREAWARFYRNTLRALRASAAVAPGDNGPIGTFRRIYEHAAGLLRGRRVLDAGTCFGFFPMILALAGGCDRSVTATDVDPPTVALAREMAIDMRLPVRFAVSDLRRLPGGPATYDTVTALHVIEHLPAPVTIPVLAGLCAAARQRVVIAVPLEDEPDAVYGHRQALDLERLAELASSVPGWTGRAHGYLGGWLVMEPSGACAGAAG